MLTLSLVSAAFAGPVYTDTLGGNQSSNQNDWAYKLDVLDLPGVVLLRTISPRLGWLTGGNYLGDDEVVYLVYRETEPDTWSLLWQSPPTAVGADVDFKESPPIDIQLGPGRIAVGVWFAEGNYSYYWNNVSNTPYAWGLAVGNVNTTSDTTFEVPLEIDSAPGGSTYHMQVSIEILDGDADGVLYDDDCDDNNPALYDLGGPELCDNIDNNCNGTVDENVVFTTWYADVDGDGFGDLSNTTAVCDGSQPNGFVADDTDCNDADELTFPGGEELCDGIDTDCDGTLDNDPTTFTLYADVDGDGFGDPLAPNEICDGVTPLDHVANDDDCDDTTPLVYPGAPELCDGRDNDCDGGLDENQFLDVYFADADGDGFGDPLTLIEACAAPPSHVSGSGDCDDTDADRFPGNIEICDGKDNDCDSLAGGEGDFDGDGWLDCDDCSSDDPTTYPGAVELCDGIDHDCDGVIPDALACDPAPTEEVALGGCSGCTSGGSANFSWLLLPLLGASWRRRSTRLAPTLAQRTLVR